MSSLTTLARPYAKAAFELAQDDNDLGRWDDMLNLAGSLVADESIQRLLDSPDITSSQVVDIINEAAGDAFNERFHGFLTVLASYDRLSLLPQVAELFRQFRAEAERRLNVRVVSALALDDDQSERMKAALAARYERDIELINEIDPDVIGGAIVYAGDQVIDGSLRGRLQKLSNSLAN